MPQTTKSGVGKATQARDGKTGHHFWTDGHDAPLAAPAVEDADDAGGVIAVEADLLTKEASADEDLDHGRDRQPRSCPYRCRSRKQRLLKTSP